MDPWTMDSTIQHSRGAKYQALRTNGTTSSRRRLISEPPSAFLESPGKKYPRLCLLLLALFLFFLISWLPHMSEKSRGPRTFVWPVNQSRSARMIVDPEHDTTLITPEAICNTTCPYLLVVVCSAVDNFAARVAIRESWARDQDRLKQVKVVFMLGHLINGTSQDRIEEEASKHQDIIQEDFVDSYANLTIKSVMLLKWYTQLCDSQAKLPQYILKTDDDMYINLMKLYETVQSNKKPGLLMGSLICNAVPIKDPYNKWYVPSYMFSERRYPNYLSGTAYLMARSTAVALYKAALDTPLFHLEDIYITGILARKAKIKPADNIGFAYTKRKLNSCLFKQTISTHHVKHVEMKAIYAKLVESQATSCAPIRAKLLREYGPGKCRWTKQSG